MISKTTVSFRNAIAKLPKDIRRRAKDAYKLFDDDPNHPSLRFKKVHARESVYSARISLDYRALGVLDGDVIVWFWVGSHAEYEKLLQQL
jgi:mRNA-degrading endonuclease RelE of RelBE toxin-antitoxin system